MPDKGEGGSTGAAACVCYYMESAEGCQKLFTLVTLHKYGRKDWVCSIEPVCRGENCPAACK